MSANLRSALIALIALIVVLFAAPAYAPPINPNSYFTPYMGHFDYWSRCSDRKIQPERRIGYCRSMLGDGRGGDASAWTEIGIAYREEHNYDAAIDAFRSALMHYGDGAFIEARGELDDVLALSGHYDSAIQDADTAVKQHPDASDAYNERCWLRAITGNELDQALADCNKALEENPRDPGALDSRGLVEFKLGKLDLAAADYGAALAAQPHLASSLFMRGIIELKKGDMAASNADIAAAKDRDPLIADEYATYGVPS